MWAVPSFKVTDKPSFPASVCVMWLSYLQQQIVVDLGEDGRVVVDVADGDGDENRRGQRRTAFICRLHRQRVMRDLGRGRR